MLAQTRYKSGARAVTGKTQALSPLPSAVSKDLFGHEAVSPLPLGEGEGFFPRPAGTLTPRPLPWGEDATGPSLPCPKRLPDCALVPFSCLEESVC